MRETFNFVHLIFFIFIALLISSCVSDETFMNAIVSKDEKRVKQLIEKGADVNGSQSPYKGLIVPTARCTMPLPCAAYAGNINIVKMLVANGADVNKFHKDGSSAINEAVVSNSVPIVRYLLKKGANPEPRYDAFWGLLQLSELPRPIVNACKWSVDIEIIKLLVKYGANVKTVDGDSHPPIYYAAKNLRVDILRVLHRNGARLDWKDSEGNSIVSAALLRCDLSSDSKKLRGKKYQNRCVETIEYLIDHGVDVNVVDGIQLTPLNRAIHQDHVPLVRMLIRKGANINFERGDSKTTPIMEVQSAEVLRILLNAGAHINARNNEGKTALHQFEARSSLHPNPASELSEIVAVLKAFQIHASQAKTEEDTNPHDSSVNTQSHSIDSADSTSGR